jgi:hypothetical protein
MIATRRRAASRSLEEQLLRSDEGQGTEDVTVTADQATRLDNLASASGEHHDEAQTWMLDRRT